MAIAVFSDIHGNLEALEAILGNIKRNRKIKEIIFLGDAVTFGPDSSACLKLLRKHHVKCIVGNHEQRMVRYDKSVAEMTTGGVKHMEYIYNSLDNEDLRYIKEMPLDIMIDYKGYRLCFTHYGHNNNGVVYEDLDCFREDLLDRMFEKYDCDAVFLGHLHERRIYMRQGKRSYFCLGSSGCCRGNKTNYTYFDIGNNQTDNYDLFRVDVKFNRAKFVKKFMDEPIPEKERFAKFFGIELTPQAKPLSYATSPIGEGVYD